MVENSVPGEAARVAIDVAQSIVARGTAPADIVALAQEVLRLGEEQIAARLCLRPEHGRESPDQLDQTNDAAGLVLVARRDDSAATAGQIALSGLRLEGADLILTLTAPASLVGATEVVGNGTTVEFRPVGGGEAVQAIDLHCDITDAQLSFQTTDDGLALRIHRYSDDSTGSDGVEAGIHDSAISSPDPWDKMIGPVYDVAGVAHRLRISADAVQHLARQHHLLGCMTADGVLVFPAFQFDEGGASTLLGLADVLTILAAGTDDRWQVALWMTTPTDQLHGQTPIGALKHKQTEYVRLLARRDAGRWRTY